MLERSWIGDARQEHLYAMVVHHTARPRAVAGLQLREVLPHRDQLHPVARRRRRQHVQLGQGRHVGGLVEHDQKRRVERAALAPNAFVGGLDHLCHESREQGSQTTLVVRGGAQVQGVGAVEQPHGVDGVGGTGTGGRLGGGHDGIGECLDHADDVGHISSGSGCRQEQGREKLGGGCVPEVSIAQGAG